MGLLETDSDNIQAAVEHWDPGELGSEKAYENALRKHLHEVFPEDKFHRQYSRANTTADIFVDFGESGCEVAIELKANLTKRTEMHRLIGQAWDYIEHWNCELVLVVCGAKSDPALVRTASKAVRGLPSNRKVRFVDKT